MKEKIAKLLLAMGYEDVQVKAESARSMRWFTITTKLTPKFGWLRRHDRSAEEAVRLLMEKERVSGGVDVWGCG